MCSVNPVTPLTPLSPSPPSLPPSLPFTGKVQNLKVTNLNSSAVLISWDPLGFDISFYTVSYSLGLTSAQTTIRVLGNTSVAVFGGLLPGEGYQFMVSAVVVANGIQVTGNETSYSFVFITGR